MPNYFFTELEALRVESQMWAYHAPTDRTIMAGTDGFSMADVAASASRTSDLLGLTATELSWIASETGLLEIYEELRLKTSRLLDEATTNFEAVADALLDTMREYSRTDDEVDAAIRDVWQPQTPDTDN